MRSTMPSSSFTRRTSRELSPSPRMKASRSRSGASGWRNGTTGQEASRTQRSNGRSSRGRAQRRLRGLGGALADGRAPGRVAEGGLHPRQHRVGVEVAGRHHHQVLGRVPAAVERAHLLAVEGGDTLRCSEDGGARSRAPGRRRREEGVREHVVRVVLGAPDLLEHHLHLAGDLVRVEDRVLHRIGQHVEPEERDVRGERRVVAGDVERGEGVDPPAGALHGAGDLAHPARARPLEEHVLVEVGEPALARALVRRADGGPDLDLGHRRHRERAQQQHGQPVGKGLHPDLGTHGRGA